MSRPFKGYTKEMFIYLSPQNDAFIRKEAKAATTSNSAVINAMLDALRTKKKAVKSGKAG